MVRRVRHAILAWLFVVAGVAPASAFAGGEVGPLVTVAGGGVGPTTVDGSPATEIALGLPGGLDMDPAGNLYIGEREGWVRKVDPQGSLTTVAGIGRDGGLESVQGVAFLAPGWLYITDPAAHQVRAVLPDGRIGTVAGTGEEGVGGDGGYATNAQLRRPTDVAVGPEGQLYIADSDAHQVRMVRTFAEGEPLATDGTITTIAGTGEEGSGGDRGPATAAQLASPFRIAVGPDGGLYILESPAGGARVRRVDPDGTISTVVGGGECDGDGESGSLSLCEGASDIAVDAMGSLYVHDRASDAVWRLTRNRELTRLPTYLSHVFSLTVGMDGGLYVGRRLDAAPYDNVVQRVSVSEPMPPASATEPHPPWDGWSAGTLALIAGTGVRGFSGDGGRGAQAELAEPGRLAVGADGTVYIADTLNNRVRSVGVDGIIETFAGNGELAEQPPKEVAGPAPGDGTFATEIPLRSPSGAGPDGGLATGPDGSVYICDPHGSRVYRVNPLGVITTYAGTGGQAYTGDGGLAVDAALAQPIDVAVGADGSVYVADNGNDRIRRVDPGGVITTIAELDGPDAVDVRPDGAVYAVAGGRIWRIGPPGTVPSVTPYANEVANPGDIAVGPDGHLYVSSGAQVFAIQEDGTAKVVAGTGDGGERASGEGPAVEADLPTVNAIAFDPAGNLYLSHTEANQVTAVVRVTEQPDGLPWHWLILAVVAAVALAAVAVSFRQTGRLGPHQVRRPANRK